MSALAFGLRSVMVDGSSRGRVEVPLLDLEVSDDGRWVYVAHRSHDQRRGLATRCSLDDGRRERFASAPRAGKSHDWQVTSSGRAFALPPRGGALTWRDPEGRTGALALDADETLHAVSRDGRYVAYAREGARSTGLRVVDVEGGVTRGEVEFTRSYSVRDAVCDRFVVCQPRLGELQRARLTGGDVRSIATVSAADRRWLSYAVDRAGARVAVLCDERLRVLDLDGLEVVATREARDLRRVYALEGDRVLARVSAPRGVRLLVIDLARGAETPFDIVGNDHTVRLTPDARRVVHETDGVVRLYDIETRRHVDLHDGPDARVVSLGWSRDGARLAAVCADRTVRVLDPRRGEVEWIFEAQPEQGWAPWMQAVFSPDGRWLHAVSGEGVLTWSLSTGHEVHRAPMPEGTWTGGVAISPDGRWLVATFDPGRAESRRGPSHLARFDMHDGSRVVSRASLPRSVERDQLRLRFAGDDELECFVRHANTRGESAVMRLSLDGDLRSVSRRGFRASADVIPLDDGRLVVLDRGRWSVASPGAPSSSGGRTVDGATLDVALDARADLAAFAMHDDLRDGLVVLDLATGDVRGLAWTSRGAVGGVFSPDGARLAVRYSDGGAEVFALDESASVAVVPSARRE